ncbi:MAG: signal peptidase II [Planctomycetota bacterium]
MSTRARRAAWLLVAAAIATLDLWTKQLWDYPLTLDGDPWIEGRPLLQTTVFESWLAVRTIWNPGAVWSAPIAPTLLLWATGLAVPIVAVWIFWSPRVRTWETFAKALILGGAIGNFWDRLQFRAVRDWIDVYFGDVNGWHWPTFNVADMALVGGISVLMVMSFLPEKEPEEAA